MLEGMSRPTPVSTSKCTNTPTPRHNMKRAWFLALISSVFVLFAHASRVVCSGQGHHGEAVRVEHDRAGCGFKGWQQEIAEGCDDASGDAATYVTAGSASSCRFALCGGMS